MRANQERNTQWNWCLLLTALLVLPEILYNQPVPERSANSYAGTCTNVTNTAMIFKTDTCANMCTVFMHYTEYLLMYKIALPPPETTADVAAHNLKLIVNQMWTLSHMLNHAFLFHMVCNIKLPYYLSYSIYNMYIDVSAKLTTFRSYIQELEKLVKLENEEVVQQLDHINSLLNKAVLTCKASTSASKLPHPSKPLEAKEYIAPGQNLKLQPRGFSKTTHTPGRKKNGLVLR